MSDERLRSVRRAYDQGAASRAEWLSALARVEPHLVELAAYCYDDDALAALGLPPQANAAQRFDAHLWASTLPHVVRLARKEWPIREVEARAALVVAHVTANAWCTLPCERRVCVAEAEALMWPAGSGHLQSLHYDEVVPALNWAERAIAGRTSWRRLASEPMGLDAQAWLDQDWPITITTGAVSVVRSRLPGEGRISLVTVAGRLARDLSVPVYMPAYLAAVAEHIERDLPARLASDLAPWILGERDPVRERLRQRGQRPVAARG